MRKAPAHPYPRRAQPPFQPEIPGWNLGPTLPPQTQPHPVPRSQAGKGFLLTSN